MGSWETSSLGSMTSSHTRWFSFYLFNHYCKEDLQSMIQKLSIIRDKLGTKYFLTINSIFGCLVRDFIVLHPFFHSRILLLWIQQNCTDFIYKRLEKMLWDSTINEWYLPEIRLCDIQEISRIKFFLPPQIWRISRVLSSLLHFIIKMSSWNSAFSSRMERLPILVL